MQEFPVYDLSREIRLNQTTEQRFWDLTPNSILPVEAKRHLNVNFMQISSDRVKFLD
jgi:hypothetical protein